MQRESNCAILFDFSSINFCEIYFTSTMEERRREMKRDDRLTQDMSKVEVKGIEAKYYDILMNILTLGKYPSFIRKALRQTALKEGERVLDMGCGSGRNALLIREMIGESGSYTGLDIGREMIDGFRKRCGGFDNMEILDMHIDSTLAFEEEFDAVLVSFVLHGFVQEKRDTIIENAYRALKKGGVFNIVDYSNFVVDDAPLPVRFAIRKMECPLAEDFIRRDTKEMLSAFGFDSFEEYFHFGGYVRVLRAHKGE